MTNPSDHGRHEKNTSARRPEAGGEKDFEILGFAQVPKQRFLYISLALLAAEIENASHRAKKNTKNLNPGLCIASYNIGKCDIRCHERD